MTHQKNSMSDAGKSFVDMDSYYYDDSIPTTTTTIIRSTDDGDDDDRTCEKTPSLVSNAVSLGVEPVSNRSLALISAPLMIVVRKFRNATDSRLSCTNPQQEYEETVRIVKTLLDEQTRNLAINFTYSIPDSYFHNDFVIKFHINILAQSPMTKRCSTINANPLVNALFNFCKKLCLAFHNMHGIVCEYPFNSLNRLYEEVTETLNNIDYYSLKIESLSIGSILNLSSFVSRIDASKSKVHKTYPQAEVDFKKKQLKFAFQVFSDHISYRLEIKFSSIKFLLLEMADPEDNQNNRHRVYLELNSAPFLNVELREPRKKVQFERVRNFQKSDFSPEVSISERFVQLCKGKIKRSDPDIIGYTYGYRFEISKDQLNIGILIHLCYTCKEFNPNFSFYIGKIKMVKFNTMNLNEISDTIDYYFKENYTINYACRVLFYKSYKIIDLLVFKNDLERFFRRIRSLSEENETLVEECIYFLDTHYKNHILDLLAEFDKLYQEKSKIAIACTKKSLNRTDHVIMRQAILTPTKIEFGRPIALLRSRFSNIANLDYSLRITVMEDNHGRLNYSTSENKFVKESIKPRLLEGFKVGDRVFHFLGSSSSQMRESGIIFYAKDDQSRTAQSIRDLVGNLAGFKRKVAKYIARFGLVFSQAIAYYNYGNDVKIYKAKDMQTEAKDITFTFTDGIGIISERIAKNIVPLLRAPPGYFPSAFQIRNGGCKGMLVSYDTVEDMIIFRNSMIKYESNDNSLGILKFSAPRAVYLNRPLIMILDQQQVPPKVFYKFFTASTKMIGRALKFDADAFHLVKIYRNNNLSYEKFYRAGISFLREPVLRQILNHLAYYRLNELKLRARIQVPLENGRCAFGVIDERRTLNSGEIFFQYSELNSEGQPTGKTVILEGEVMVTKFPCLSLGDVRKFRAVNITYLRHIKDCLVFPAKGDRPHTDEMGGSDLDGDEYAIFWRTDLIFPGPNAEPMDFNSQDPGELNHDITIEDIVDFYCDFLLENNIGQVANSHLMYSDFHPSGLRSQECETLAVKYSISLDFQKSGVNSELEKTFQPNFRWIKPDFMCQHSNLNSTKHSNYLSQKILGQFYRHCCLIEAIIQMTDSHLVAEEQNAFNKPEPSFIIQGWRRFEELANEAFIEYHHLVIETIQTLDIDSEVAFLSDVFEDRPDVASFQIDKVFTHFQHKFECQSQGLNENDKLLLISAWYAVCFEKSDLLQYHYQDKPLLGLPFMVPDMMIRLAEATQQNIRRKILPATAGIEELLCQNEKLVEHLKELAEELIIYWMKYINKFVFGHGKSFPTIKYREGSDAPWKIENENVFLATIIKEKIAIIVTDYISQFALLVNDERKAVLFLFNQFLIYLSELNNQVNNYMLYPQKLRDVFLFRYALFAPIFINKLDAEHLEKPCDNNSKFSCKQLDPMFDTFSHCLFMRKNSFCMINNQHPKIDYTKLDSGFFRKLRFLCGALKKEMKIFDHNDTLIYSTAPNGDLNQCGRIDFSDCPASSLSGKEMGVNLLRYNLKFFTMEISGCTASIVLLQLFLGHPNFYMNIYKNFEILNHRHP